MKIGFLSADWGAAIHPETEEKILIPGGSGWYRIHLPALELEKNGFDVVISEQVSVTNNGLSLIDWRDNSQHDDCDIIVMQRIMNDFGIDLIKSAKAAGQKVINDIDDWYWGLHPKNNAYKATDPKYNPDCNRNHYKESILSSDLIISSTPFLHEQVSGWGCDSIVVRNSVDLDKWNVEEQNVKPVVGWVGSTMHRSGDLETLTGIVDPFIERNDLKFHHGGWTENAPHAAQLMNVNIDRCTHTPLCQIELYPQHFKFFDISLIPLNKIPFNEAKSFIKGIESAAAGKPFIAQNTGEYVYLQEQYGIGRVAKKPKDWIKHLNELLDYDLRVEESEFNRKAVEALDIKNIWTNWRDAILSVA